MTDKEFVQSIYEDSKVVNWSHKRICIARCDKVCVYDVLTNAEPTEEKAWESARKEIERRMIECLLY